MADQMGILPSLVREEAFEIAVRGYQRRQVDEFVAGTRAQIRHLQERLNQALDTAESARHDLTELHEQYASRPAHEVVSERMSQILKLAEEEADQSRARADDDIAQIRRAALEEAQRICDVAREQSETIIETARQQSEQEAQRVRGEADALLHSSRQESESTLLSAQERSAHTLGSAEARATAVDDVVERRLEVLTATHDDATRRLTQMRDLLAEILGEDEAAGPLRAAVDLAGDFPIVLPDADASPAQESPEPEPQPAGDQAAAAPAEQYGEQYAGQDADASPAQESPERDGAGEVEGEQSEREPERVVSAEIVDPRVLDVDAAAASDIAREAERTPSAGADSAAAAAAAAAAARGRHHRS